MEIRREECGCTVQQDHDARVHIEYCPKHKSAPDLYEACKYYADARNWEIINRVPSPTTQLAEQAVRKAEGGK